MALKIDVQVSPQEQEMYELKKRLRQLEEEHKQATQELAVLKQSLKTKGVI